MLRHCPNCKAEALKERMIAKTRKVADHTFHALLPAQQCRSCAEVFFDGRVIGRFELQIAASLCAAGITSGAAVAFIRKAYGMSGKDLARLLGVRAETVSRWEHAKRSIERGTYAVLHQLISDRLHDRSATADYLRSLHKPKRLPRIVKLRIDRAA